MRCFVFTGVLAVLNLVTIVGIAAPLPPTSPYAKRIYNSVGSGWYARVDANHTRLATGTVRVSLVIGPDGAIRKLQILSNTSDKLHARIVLDAIRHAKIPRPPPEVLKDGVFRSDMDFTIYPK